MRKIIIVFILLASGLFSGIEGRASGSDVSAVLEKLFTRLLSLREDSDRIRINDSINLIINSYAESDSVFTHKFSSLKYLGQITSKNSRLKIITWNLLLKDTQSRYYCYFIHNTGKKNNVYRLEGIYREEPARSDITYSIRDWYGALYYDMRPFRQGGRDYWVLLGIDFGNPAITRKIIDIVSFTQEGELIFGMKLFSTGDVTKYREVLEYNAGAVVSLKFVSGKSIVFDHLVPVSPAMKDNKENYGPDFSYDAYNLEQGIWKFKSDIDIRNKKN